MKLFTPNSASLRALLALSTFVFIGGCTPKYQAYLVQYECASAGGALPNYSDLYYWAAHPWKADPSDSIPAGIGDRARDSLVDVFFIHPTTYTRRRTEWNGNIHDAALNAKTDYSPILYQASVFNRYGRVFAPRYRQAHLSAFFTDTALMRDVFQTAYEDVRSAFEHYLAVYHNNRPIIIAGHSQGALIAERLLREFFDGTPLQERLVAAYVVGWPIPQGYFKSLPPCTSAGQTGCFAGWRTFQSGYTPGYVDREVVPSHVTNPLNWRADTAYASHELNRGSVLRNFNAVVPQLTDAFVRGSVLWVNKPRLGVERVLLGKNYHIGDINLFYMNIRENVGERVRGFLSRESGVIESLSH